MPDIKFSCKDCVFAISDEYQQIDCKLNRLEKLNRDYKTQALPKDDKFYHFDRFCNTFRPPVWLETYHNNDIEIATNEVYKEVYPRLTFIIQFNYDLYNLISILHDIENQTIPNRKFVIVINDKVEYNEDIFDNMENILKTNIGSYHLVQSMPNLDKEYLNDEGFKLAKNGWTVFLKDGATIQRNFAEIIHNRINIDMKRFVFAQNKNGNKMIIQSAIYKLLNGNKPKTNKDESIDDRPFLEKFNDLEQTDPDSVIEWGKLFDE